LQAFINCAVQMYEKQFFIQKGFSPQLAFLFHVASSRLQPGLIH